jgi:hypothetical protein
MEPLEYICMGFCICLALVFAVYYGSVCFLDWYNREHLPSRKPELMNDQNGNPMTVRWVYDGKKGIAVRACQYVPRPFEPDISAPKPPPPVFGGTAPPVETGIVGTGLPPPDCAEISSTSYISVPPQTYDDKGNVKP